MKQNFPPPTFSSDGHCPIHQSGNLPIQMTVRPLDRNVKQKILWTKIPKCCKFTHFSTFGLYKVEECHPIATLVPRRPCSWNQLEREKGIRPPKIRCGTSEGSHPEHFFSLPKKKKNVLPRFLDFPFVSEMTATLEPPSGRLREWRKRATVRQRGRTSQIFFQDE